MYHLKHTGKQTELECPVCKTWILLDKDQKHGKEPHRCSNCRYVSAVDFTTIAAKHVYLTNIDWQEKDQEES